MGRIDNKVVVVTGAACGIGRAISKKLALEGGVVAVTDILDDKAQQLAGEINESGGRAEFWHMDTSEEENVKQVFAEVNEKLGGIDVLINNAGIAGPNKATHEVDLEEWDQVMSINVKGVFLCTKHAVPYMIQDNKGSIINLSSIYGIISAPDLPPYHASKGAVRLMTKTDALLYAKNQIRVNSIHPGYIWTPLVEGLARSSDQSVEDFRKDLDAKHPIGHVGEPEDIAYAALYLASEEAKFVTGAEIVVDGGYTAE